MARGTARRDAPCLGLCLDPCLGLCLGSSLTAYLHLHHHHDRTRKHERRKNNMLIALAFWGASIVTCIAVSLYLCRKIEASGVRRWGATGKLLSYE
jgi:hypothetical protein